MTGTISKGVMKYIVPAVHGEHTISAPIWWQPLSVTSHGRVKMLTIWAEVDAPKGIDIDRRIKVYAPNQSHGQTHDEIYIGMVIHETEGPMFVYELGEPHA